MNPNQDPQNSEQNNTPVVPSAPISPNPAPVQPPEPASVQPTAAPEGYSSVSQAQGQPVASSPAPTPQPTSAPSTEDPGKTMGIIGFVMSLFGFTFVSLIVSVIARNKSKKAGHSNGWALAGIIISTITFVIGLVISAFLVMGIFKAAEYCKDNGTQVQNSDGSMSYECSAGSTPGSSEAMDESRLDLQPVTN